MTEKRLEAIAKKVSGIRTKTGWKVRELISDELRHLRIHPDWRAYWNEVIRRLIANPC